MFELNDSEEEFCDCLIDSAVALATSFVIKDRPGEVAEIDDEVRVRMIGALENTSPYGPVGWSYE